MKKVLKIILLLTIFYHNYAVAGSSYRNMVLDSNHSFVSFATIKKQYTVEAATFNAINGSINDNNVKLNINIASVDTKVPIRNDRLKKLFFQNGLFPNINISANLDKKLLKFKNVKKAKISFKVEMFGNSKTIETEVLIAKVYNKKLMVATTKPLIISASDFGIPSSNLNKLAETVGGIAISDKVPVNFILTFSKK